MTNMNKIQTQLTKVTKPPRPLNLRLKNEFKHIKSEYFMSTFITSLSLVHY